MQAKNEYCEYLFAQTFSVFLTPFKLTQQYGIKGQKSQQFFSVEKNQT